MALNTRILLDHEPVADGGYLVRALLRITGEAPAAASRPPLDVALVLDRSGSMNGDKLARRKPRACWCAGWVTTTSPWTPAAPAPVAASGQEC